MHSRDATCFVRLFRLDLRCYIASPPKPPTECNKHLSDTYTLCTCGILMQMQNAIPSGAQPGVGRYAHAQEPNPLIPPSLLRQETVLWMLTACAAWIATMLYSGLGAVSVAVPLAVAASVVSLHALRLLSQNLFTLCVLFFVGHILYGIPSVLFVHLGGSYSDLYPKPYLNDVFLFHYGLASIGLLMGASCAALRRSYTASSSPATSSASALATGLLWTAYALAIVASFLEILLFLRTGGIAGITLGKPSYHLAVGERGALLDIFGNSSFFLSCGLLGLSMRFCPARVHLRYTRLLLWLLMCAPVLMTALIVGQRSRIVFAVICFLMGYFFYEPIRKVNSKLFIIALMLYVLASFLFVARAFVGQILAGSVSWHVLFSIEPEYWLRAINPVFLEFGAAFVNFNTYMLQGDHTYLWGETYLRGIVSLWLTLMGQPRLPNITEEFNTTFFPQMVQLGVGNAFSSLLEAYINFGTLGVGFVYYLVGLVLVLLERQRARKHSLWFTMLYILLVPQAIVFHRSNFGPTVWLIPLVSATAGYGLFCLLRVVRVRRQPCTGQEAI